MLFGSHIATTLSARAAADCGTIEYRNVGRDQRAGDGLWSVRAPAAAAGGARQGDRIVQSYLTARDQLEPVRREDLLERARAGTVFVLDVSTEEASP